MVPYSKKLKFYHLILLLPVLLLYNNCDGYKGSDGSVNGSNSANCLNTASASLKLLNFDATVDCQNTSRIHCELRSFAPENSNETIQAKHCLDSSAYGEGFCLELVERYYNTDGAGENPQDYALGGAYNYQEYNCYMDHFVADKKPVFSSSKPSLQESLNELHRICQKAGEQ